MSDHSNFVRLDLAPTISKRRYSSSSLPTSFSILVLFELLEPIRGLKTEEDQEKSHVASGARSLLSNAR